MTGSRNCSFFFFSVVYLVSVSLSATRTSNVLLIAVNTYLRHLTERSVLGRLQSLLSGGHYQETEVRSLARVPINQMNWYQINQRTHLKRLLFLSCGLFVNFLYLSFYSTKSVALDTEGNICYSKDSS